MVFAYIDPGAGSMIIQTIIAGALAVPFIMRTQISQALAKLRRNRDAEGPKDPTSRSD